MRIAEEPHPVVVAPGLSGLAELLERPGVLVTEQNVAACWEAGASAALGDGLRAAIVLPPGEAHKTVAGWERCARALVDAGVDRGTPVIALGGGTLTDLAGFAAATTLRGLPWIAAPTTLLGMVDAAIGGKTGVNLPAGKNLVGAFHLPRAAWLALETLSTLPARELRCGWGEVIKTALVGDPALLDAPPALAEVVARCAAVKARVVAADPEERAASGRIALNLGHTVAHAIETATDGAIAHGEAVGLGLLAEARWALREGICLDPDLPDRIQAALERVGLPTSVPAIDPSRLLAALRVDKKGAADMIRLPLPERAGTVIVAELPRSRLAELLDGLPAPRRVHP